jgi:uncharacterized SAM-binding protein YcdF (DUF218 family)
MIWRTLARVLERPLAQAATTLDPGEPRDAIVVLGAALRSDHRLTPVLAERVAAAAMLFAAGAAPLVIVTGGVTSRVRRPEAAVIADALVIAGVPRASILVEDRSQTTAENARNVAALVPAHVHAIWLVTQPFHARRAEYLFRAAGFAARAWQVTDSLQYRDHRRAVRWLLREYAAWVKVWLTS